VSLLLRLQANRGLQDFENRGQFRRLMCYFFLSLVIADPKREQDIKDLLKVFLPVVRWVSGLLNRLRGQPTLTSANEQDQSTLRSVNEVRIRQLAKPLTQPLPTVTQKPRTNIATTDTTTPSTSGKSFSDYRSRVRPYNKLFQIVYLPEIHRYFQLDRAFAAQRVAGANPLVIQQFQELDPRFPINNDHYQSVMGVTDSLAHAMAEGRLYLADYADLKDITPGNFPKGVTKYVYAPLALFAIPAGTGTQRALVPIAIQCGQDPSQYPIITPPPPSTPQAGQWDWLIAKTIVQIADGNYHELISHLGRTHLLIEAFAISTPRQLAENHPLSLLLTPHFEGTLFINDAALTGLVNPEGTVDRVLFGTLQDSLKLSITGAKGYPYRFNESMLPKTFAARGVGDPNKLPDYPYRDDALLIWHAIQTWVRDYLCLYYHTDEDVQNDTELQAWSKELLAPDGGQMVDFGEPNAQGDLCLQTREYLIQAVTLIIFTASAQHTAVNFPQATYLTYGPNMPLAGYHPAPTKAGSSADDYFELLPSLAQAENQMNMTYTLGSVYYTQLGKYPDHYFTDQAVAPLLIQFQQQLEEIALTIEDRNRQRPTYYDTLLPNKIPQSINI
jgi:arachidonate 15-lipoxygenase